MPAQPLPAGHPTNISPGCKRLLQRQDEMHRQSMEDLKESNKEALDNKQQVINLLTRISLGLLAALLAFFGLQARLG